MVAAPARRSRRPDARRASAALLAAWSFACCSPALAADPDSTRGGDSPYLDLVGIGWSEKLEDGPRFVWRPEWPGIEPGESISIFKYLAGDRTEECLAAILDSRPSLRAELATMGAGTVCGGSPEAIRQARELWTSFGFAAALAEVARVGRPGDAVARFHARCDDLRDRQAQEPRATPTP